MPLRNSSRVISGIVFNVSADGALQELPIPSERDREDFGYFFDRCSL
jgi:hypothetical protein